MLKLVVCMCGNYCTFQRIKSSPVTGPEGPREIQEVKVSRFRDNGTGWW